MYLLFEMVFLCSLGYPGALIAQFHSPRCCNYRYCHYRALKWVATLTHTQNWGWKLSLGHARQVYCPELSPPYLFFFFTLFIFNVTCFWNVETIFHWQAARLCISVSLAIIWMSVDGILHPTKQLASAPRRATYMCRYARISWGWNKDLIQPVRQGLWHRAASHFLSACVDLCKCVTYVCVPLCLCTYEFLHKPEKNTRRLALSHPTLFPGDRIFPWTWN